MDNVGETVRGDMFAEYCKYCRILSKSNVEGLLNIYNIVLLCKIPVYKRMDYYMENKNV